MEIVIVDVGFLSQSPLNLRINLVTVVCINSIFIIIALLLYSGFNFIFIVKVLIEFNY